MVVKTIKLTSLFVNTENYRFEPLSSQKEAIDKMVEDQGDKLYSLVDDIVTNGLSPVDLIIVTPNEDNNKYIVLEGNRRITSLKLLNNPTLIDDKYISLRKKFQKLQKENPNAISELKNIACAVFENPTEADIWIKRKHSGELNGIGTVTWNAQQKQRFEEKTEGKSSIPLQIITLLKSQDNVSDTIKDSLSKLNITNLQRLMSDPYVREHLGLGINNGTLVSKVEVSEVVKGLIKVVTDILNPEFKVSEIYNREKRKQYIDNFDTNQKPDLSNEASEQWSVQDIVDNKGQVLINSERREIKKANNQKARNRAGLVPKTLILHINNPKINKIFEELKHIQVKTCVFTCKKLLMTKKKLPVRFTGQHFTIDKVLIKDAIRQANISNQDTVLDIGAGKGFLTVHLLKIANNVVAIENDTALVEHLRKLFSDARNVQVVGCDFRNFAVPKFPFKVVSNIPYGITSDIFKILMFESLGNFLGGSIVLQLEPTQKLFSRKLYNPYTVFYHTFFDLKLVYEVGPESFLPPPTVKSALLNIKRKHLFFDFKFKAKYLAFISCLLEKPDLSVKTALKSIFRKSQVRSISEKFGLNLNAQIVCLSPSQWLNCFLEMLEVVPEKFHPS